MTEEIKATEELKKQFSAESEINGDTQDDQEVVIDQSDSDFDENKSGKLPRILILTDDLIAQYSERNVLVEYRDIDLRVTTKLAPYPNGVYDQDIFGSLFGDRCNCGTMRTPGYPCPRCGSMILTDEEQYKRFARIELPVFYTTVYKQKRLIKLIRANFAVKTDFKSKFFTDLHWTTDKVLDICQWNYDPNEKDTLTVTDTITDYTNCSWEGLLKILTEYYPNLVDEFRSYVNQYVLVVPIALRAPVIRVNDNGERKLENNLITIIYKNIIYAIQNYYNEEFPAIKSESSKSMFRGCLRRLISHNLNKLSNLLQPSKANMARYMQSHRLANSGRCVIAEDSNLRVDEVVIPRFLMYECCRDEFIKFIAKKKNINEKEAEIIYKTQSDLDDTQKMFDEYINGEPGKPETAKYVIINRPPTLYSYSMFACRVKLTYDYCMKIPQGLCKPFNADFDGDQMAFYAVPKELNNDVNEGLGSKNRFFYRKNNVPLYVPDQEILQGLILATRIIIQRTPLKFDSIAEAKEYRKAHPDQFKWQTLCVINGKRTTLGRAILSELFNKDVDGYLEGIKADNIDGKNVLWLYEQMREYDPNDRMNRIRDIQQFAVQVATMSGSTAVRLADLYLNIDNDIYAEMKKVWDNEDLSDKAKEVKIRDLYTQYQTRMLKEIPEDVRQTIKDSVTSKVDQLIAMALPQVNVGPDGSFHLGTTSLAAGMSSHDYIWHATDNRAVQDIKQQDVPQSGYVTRQYVYLASEWIFKDGEDKKNRGILLDGKFADGRTLVDGSIQHGPAKTPVLVRSVITSTLPAGVITKDMTSNKFDYKDGDRIGMTNITSFTESLTQAGLALKHGGNLMTLSDQEELLAPDEGKVSSDDHWVYFTNSKGKVYKYPKAEHWTVSFKEGGVYKKGELVGCNYKHVTPSMTGLVPLIMLLKAKGTVGHKSFEKLKPTASDCYAREDGEIHYTYDSKSGEYKVFIGSDEYYYSPDCQYIFADGQKVKKYDRICSGVYDMQVGLEHYIDPVELYYFFRKQFKEYMNINDDLIEFVYRLSISKTEDNRLQMQSVLKNIYGSESFYKSLAFADARKSFEKIGYKGIDFVADPFTQVMLPLIVNNEIK
jgi:hypothetical protein